MSSKGSGIGGRLPKLHGLSGSWTRCMALRGLSVLGYWIKVKQRISYLREAYVELNLTS